MREALLIIDYQNDFTPPEGSLAVPGGEELGPKLSEEAADDRYELVVATRDWHPPDHSSFEQQGGRWPPHCIQGTEGAELDPRLDRSTIDLVFDKGQGHESGGYSAMESGELGALLREREIERASVAGLATDVCVRHTALDALEESLEVEVIDDLVRGVDPEDSERALAEIERAGGSLRR